MATYKRRSKNPRQIVRARISHISLCKRGKNKMKATFKSFDENDDREVVFKTLVVKDALEDEGILTCVVYPPSKMDHDNEWATKAAVKEMCHNYIARGGIIDYEHDHEPIGSDRARLAENFIIPKGHPEFQDLRDEDGNSVDAEGAWAVKIKLLDDDLKEQARTGEIGGVSMFGQAEFQEGTIAASAVDDVVEALVKRFGTSDTEDALDMTPEQLEAALVKSNKGLAETIVTGLAKALKKDDEEADEAPPAKKVKKAEVAVIEFEGDRDDPEDVRKHLDKIEAAKVDWNDPKAVETHLAKLQKAKKKADAEDGDEDEDPELAKAKSEKAKLERRIAKLEGVSSQTGKKKASQAETDDEDADDDEGDSESSRRLKLIKSGVTAVQSLNKARGYKTGS